MKVTETPFAGLLLLEPESFMDDRGWFMESYSESRFPVPVTFVQDNESCSARNVLRGMHFQVPPFEMAKLVRVVTGSVLDVAVDLRKSEPTYGKYFRIQLTAANRKQLFIPAGFAHGFLSLENDTVFSYKCSGHYSKDHDRSLRWNDPAIGIEWGPVHPLLSTRDANAPSLSQLQNPF